MILIIWLRVILSLACLALILFWLLTGREKQILLRLAGVSGLVASVLFFFTR
jgi:hypothetical protein